MDEIAQFISARNAAIEIAGLARDYLRAAEGAKAKAEELGRAAGIKVSKIHEGLPRITARIGFPEGQMPAPRDVETLPGVALAANHALGPDAAA
jgi:hypothetical protein